MSNDTINHGLSDGLVRAIADYLKQSKIDLDPGTNPLVFILTKQSDGITLAKLNAFLRSAARTKNYPRELTAYDFCRLDSHGYNAFTSPAGNSSQRIIEIIDFLKQEKKTFKAKWLLLPNKDGVSALSKICDARAADNLFIPELWGMNADGLGELANLRRQATDNHSSYARHALQDAVPKLILLIVQTVFKDGADLGNLPDIDDVRQGYTAVDITSVESMLRDEARDNPIRLIQFGKGVLDLLPDIALASLKTTADVSTNANDFSIDALTIYNQQVAEANRLVTEALGEQRSGFSRLLSFGQSTTTIDRKKYEELLKSAQTIMMEAGKTLSAATQPLTERENRLEKSLGETQRIIDFYQVVAVDVTKIKDAGSRILLEWQREAATTTVNAERQNTQHIKILEERLGLLGRSEMQITVNVARAAMQAKMDMQQWQSLHTTKVDTIPTLIQDHASFMNQIAALQRSEIIDGCVDASGRIHTSRISLRDEVLARIAGSSDAVAAAARANMTSAARDTVQPTPQ